LRDVRELSGLWRSMPVLTGVTLVAAFAYMGLPGTSGFAAEVLVFLGSMASDVVPYAPLVTALAMFGVVLVAGYLLFALQRVFYGELRLGSAAAADGGRPRVADVSFRQAAPLLVVLAAILLLGVQPDVVYDAIGSSTADVVDVVAGGEFG
ncbi:MAG: proton-conducting transporter membrane subunit, partial [Halobacteriota archaeon]